MSSRKTVLIVDDDPGILRVLSDGLANVLDMFDVVTASNGHEAIQELENRSVDVLVTDLAMPIMDGFSLIAYVSNRRSALPVVVLSGMAGSMLDQRLARYGGLRVLRKPASYQEVATCVLEEIERVDRGLIEGIPLSGILQLIEAERRSCKVNVTSGRRRGQLDFESGRLLNAFSDDFGAEGEAAAYDILSWPDTAVEFEPLPANARRLIHTPMQLLLVELATAQDRTREPDADDPTPSEELSIHASDEPHPGTLDGAVESVPDDPLGDPAEEPVANPSAAPAPEEPTPVDPAPLTDPVAAPGPVFASFDTRERVDDSILLDEAAPTEVPEAEPEVAPGFAAAEPPGTLAGADSDAIPSTVPAPRVSPSPEAPDAHVRDMLAAVDRLARRAKAADDALAAVASEIDAFREAQRRFDEANAQREQRRRDLERFRDEVAQLAREILGRVDGLFDAMASEPSPRDRGEERPTT